MLKPSKSQLIAVAAAAFEKQRTGHSPQSVMVVLSGETLVVTLHWALAVTADIKAYRRRLFDISAGAFRQKIKDITGVEVRVTAEVEPTTGSVVTVFRPGRWSRCSCSSSACNRTL